MGLLANHGVRGNKATVGKVAVRKSIALGGPTSYLGDGTYGRHLIIGVGQDNTQGNPAAPCLAIAQATFHRFRWSIASSGSHTISVNVMQVSNASPRPTLVVKADPTVGLAVDATGTAPSDTGWVTISVTITATATGPVWVELWNNLTTQYDTAYFDHITAT